MQNVFLHWAIATLTNDLSANISPVVGQVVTPEHLYLTLSHEVCDTGVASSKQIWVLGTLTQPIDTISTSLHSSVI